MELSPWRRHMRARNPKSIALSQDINEGLALGLEETGTGEDPLV